MQFTPQTPQGRRAVKRRPQCPVYPDVTRPDDYDAIRTIVDTLKNFPLEDQQRILRWSAEKLGIRLQEAALEHPLVQVRDKRGDWPPVPPPPKPPPPPPPPPKPKP